MIEDVLLVDDSTRDCVIFEAQFNRCGYSQRIVSVQNPIEALEILDGKSNELLSPNALLVLDVQIPKMDGLELAQQIRFRPQWRDVPIFFLTDAIDPENVLVAKKLDVEGIMLKQHVISLLDEPTSPINRLLNAA